MTAAKRGRTERLQIIVNTDELAVIDDFRFKSRMPSRAAAVRELLRRGLASGPRKGGPPDRPSWIAAVRISRVVLSAAIRRPSLSLAR
jgi:hypothetical protein